MKFIGIVLFVSLLSSCSVEISSKENKATETQYIVRQYSGGVLVGEWTTKKVSYSYDHIWFDDSLTKKEIVVGGEYQVIEK